MQHLSTQVEAIRIVGEDAVHFADDVCAEGQKVVVNSGLEGSSSQHVPDTGGNKSLDALSQ